MPIKTNNRITAGQISVGQTLIFTVNSRVFYFVGRMWCLSAATDKASVANALARMICKKQKEAMCCCQCDLIEAKIFSAWKRGRGGSGGKYYSPTLLFSKGCKFQNILDN